MSRIRSFIRYWLPVVLWMAVIFLASADSQSVRRSRIIEPLLRWLFPHLSKDAIGVVVLVVRKCAHLTEYAVLGLLILRALRKPARNDQRPWSWTMTAWALSLVALYAASDEIHQLFVPSREGSVRDVMIDTAGGIVGVLVLWAVGCWRGWWPNSLKKQEPT